jgi:hypothetical protein
VRRRRIVVGAVVATALLACSGLYNVSPGDDCDQHGTRVLHRGHYYTCQNDGKGRWTWTKTD